MCLLLGIGQRLLCVGESFLLHSYVFVGVDQIPIHILDLIDGGDDLQAEGDVGNFTIVLGDADEAHVGKGTEALQQVLRDPELEVRVYLGREQAFKTVGGNVAVVESH